MRYDWLVIVGILALVVIIYLLVGRGGREILQRRLFRRALTLKARDIMTRPVVVAHEDTTLEEAARLMLERDIRCLPVIGEEGALVGILTESDVTGGSTPLVRSGGALVGGRIRTEGLERAYEEMGTLQTGEVMSTPALAVGEDETITDLALAMIERGVHHVPVLDGSGLLVGIVTRHDLLRILADRFLPGAARGAARPSRRIASGS